MMNNTFNGIELTVNNNATFTNSHVLASISDNYKSSGVEYTQKLESVINAKITKGQMDAVSRVFTLITMAYQINNGGVLQYYDNGYDKGKDPYDDEDCYIYSKREISKIYRDDIIPMVKAIYGDDSRTYEKIMTIADMWDCVSYEEGETSEEYYYEDVWDEETGDYVTEEHIEEIESDPYVNMGSEFEREFYNFDEYDSIMEMYAEYTYKKYFADTNV